MLIERIKADANKIPELGSMYGKGIPGSQRYHDTIKPYTIIHSDVAIGSHLWKADGRNFCDQAKDNLIVRGALPCPSGLPDEDNPPG